MNSQAGATMTGVVLRALRRYEDRVAFRWAGGRSMTYRGCLDLIGRMQQALIAQGAARGKCAALLGGNRVELWCAGIAAQCCGMSLSWLHPRAAAASHLEQLVDVEAVLLIVDPEAFAERGGEFAHSAEWQGTVFTLGRAGYGRDLLAEADALGSATAIDLALPCDVVTLSYTGGTTGRSKAAVRRHRSSLAQAVAILADFELPEEPRYLAVGPISHVTGSNILPTLIRGGWTELMTRFDPDEMCHVIERDRINVALLIPTMIYSLLTCDALRSRDLTSLELLLYGGSATAPARMAEGIERIGPIFAQLYGQTECYPITYLGRRDHDLTDPSSLAACGYASTSAEVRLLDDDGAPVSVGAVGEICIRAPQTSEAYWKRPQETVEAFKSGWLHTGDLAVQDDRGRFSIVDRKKDMIVSGGFNLYPKEIEDVLTALPGVAMAAVVGTPDLKWGEAAIAVIVAEKGIALSADDVLAAVRRVKGSMLTPKRVEFVDSLPQTAIGKIDKKALRQRLTTAAPALSTLLLPSK
jgi:fatty-acyl-CoA synthase